MIGDNLNIIQELQRKASSVLASLVPDDVQVVILDYPNNPNVGDNLIWLGEISYLRSRGLQPRYVCDSENYNKSSLVHALGAEKSVILLSGGGNFGTVWPELQDFREKVLMDFRGVPIIQLPQSLHFDDTAKLKRAAEVIRKHGNFTLLTRDKPSFELARLNFDCDVFMCPDMAFFIGPVSLGKSPQYDRFALCRTDREMKSNWHLSLEALAGKLSVNVADWLEPGMVERVLHRIEQHTAPLRRQFDQDNLVLLRLWNILAQARMARGVALLQRGRVVITDRLHAHILSVLLGKPHALIDNSYGKIRNYYHAWTEAYSGSRLVTSVEAALRAADELDT